MVPLQTLLQYLREPLSSNHQRISGSNHPNTFSAGRKCFKCQDFGHIASDFPNHKTVSLVEGDVEIEDEDESALIIHEPAVYDDEVIYVDQGKSLVVQRSLKVDYAEDEWLQNNIFHTRCTSHGKVCDVIINGGSCENVVVATMVEKLKLETEKHSQPYKLQWLRKGNEVKVKKRCLI